MFLSNRVHPDGKGDVTPLRARVATIAASALDRSTPPAARAMPRSPGATSAPARRRAARPLAAGADRPRRAARRRLRAAARQARRPAHQPHRPRAATARRRSICCTPRRTCRLVALFSPEHGIRGILDAKVPSAKDEKTGLPIHSLYGETRRPTAAMLDGLDAIVIDLQDIGARFYTYMTTMAYVMEEAAKRKLPVVVLDRPNPDQRLPDRRARRSTRRRVGFTGYFPAMPMRHGMTLGELARLFNGENKIGADLTVVPMKNWERDHWFDETGLPWINPSPNMRNLLQATLYPGIGAIEGTNISVGRGTDTPFEQIGAPWIDGVAAGRGAERARAFPASGSIPVRFTPVVEQVREGGVPGRASWSSPIGLRCGRCGSASRSRRRCTGCTAPTFETRAAGAPVRIARRVTARSAPAKIRRRSPRSWARRGSALAAAAREVPVVSVSRFPHAP